MHEDSDYFSTLDHSKYIGEWVVIVNQQLISHDKDLKKAFKGVREKYPSCVPFVMRIPKPGEWILHP